MGKDKDYGYETASPDRYSQLKTFAHNNRKGMTPSEERLWNALRHLSCGYKFRRQHAIGDFIADFVCFMQAKVGRSFVILFRLACEVKLKSPANSVIK